MSDNAAGGIIGALAFVAILIILNLCSYWFDWPFWIY